MNRSIQHRVIIQGPEATTHQDLGLIREEPLSIRIQTNPYTVVMRTPGEEKAHVAGFCFTEGIVDTPDQIASLALCDDTNVAAVTLVPKRRADIAHILSRREFISQTSCGICGKAVISDLQQSIGPIPDSNLTFDLSRIQDLMDTMSDHQQLRQETRGAHAALIYNQDLEIVSHAEDVGRHNALDKAIGKLFLERRLPEAALLIMSSRTSYELVQKAARARIPVITSISRPTDLAADLAGDLNMTLAGRKKGGGMIVYTHARRFGINE